MIGDLPSVDVPVIVARAGVNAWQTCKKGAYLGLGGSTGFVFPSQKPFWWRADNAVRRWMK